MSFPIYRGPIPGLNDTTNIRAAVESYNRDHARDFGRAGGQCPVCGHRGCFGRIPGKPTRWACFSANHAAATGADGKPVGLPGKGCWHGDALDLDAFSAGRTRLEHLRALGYLRPRKGTP
ncbi:MAG: hypothetical protein HS108_04345 [Planctomycetes bacterium]|jgi:hypothetical protein|nr:hypothetical protein [Planctomycetota bacterium]MCL4731991.1 hypothetical protein [Planctomycetota bacterium]